VSLAHAQLAVERFIVVAPERERFLWCEEREEDAIGDSRSPLLLVIGVGDSHFRQLVLRSVAEVEGEGGTEVEAEGGKPGQFYRPVTEVWAEIKFYLRTKFTAGPLT